MTATTETDVAAVDGRNGADGEEDGDRELARLAGTVMLFWGLLWSGIIAALLLFGDVLSAIVV